MPFETVPTDTAIPHDMRTLVLKAPHDLPHELEADFAPDDGVSTIKQAVPVYRSARSGQLIVIVPRKRGSLFLRSTNKKGEVSDETIIKLGDADTARDTPTEAPAGGGGAGGRRWPPDVQNDNATLVRLERTAAEPVRGRFLWKVIRRGADALSFPRFARFVELAFCDKPRNDFEKAVKPKLIDELGGSGKYGTLIRVDSYDRLKAAAEIFVLANAAALPRQDLSLVDQSDQLGDLKNYLEDDTVLPYLRIIYDRLGIPAPETLLAERDGDMERCREILERKRQEPCFIELIWSYWHEEAMQVQAMAAISQRFQNRRAPNDRDPLLQLEIDPLRPLNHLLWKHAQGEDDRLSVLRRAHEYEHEYGFPLYGKAVSQLRVADRRSKFVEAFHNLLYRTVQFYKDDDDTTHVADGFPVLNALKETHYVLSQGAHNQFGDLPAMARQEMLIEQWILGRPEMREFLGSRPMVAYPEPWMDRVDTVKTLKGWTDVSVVHFNDLARFGEQLLLSIRWDVWSKISDPNDGKQWAREWRPEVQGYIHALRAVLGLDLAAEITNGRDESERYLPPSVLLRRRLKAQSVAR